MRHFPEIFIYWSHTQKSKDIPEKTKSVFNYRLSHARMCIECAFGVLTSRFCFLTRRLLLSPDVATTCVKAASVLHNFLIKTNDPLIQAMEAKLTTELEKDREEMKEWNYKKWSADDVAVGLFDILPHPGYHTVKEARQVCNLFATYFRSPGGYIPWQDKCTRVTDLTDWVKQFDMCIMFMECNGQIDKCNFSSLFHLTNAAEISEKTHAVTSLHTEYF